MFFDKLWVRIKGDLLTMKDDVAAGAHLRAKAAVLLAKLEELLAHKESEIGEGTPKSPHAGETAASKLDSRTDGVTEDAKHAELQDLRREWEKLQELRDERHEESKDSDIPPPNPRKLG
jgi:hypothetical protein